MANRLIDIESSNEIPVVAMETAPTVHLTMDIGTDDGTMGTDMIGAVNCAAMVGTVTNERTTQADLPAMGGYWD